MASPITPPTFARDHFWVKLRVVSQKRDYCINILELLVKYSYCIKRIYVNYQLTLNLKNNVSKMAKGLSLCDILEQIIDSKDEISDFSHIFDEGKYVIKLQ